MKLIIGTMVIGTVLLAACEKEKYDINDYRTTGHALCSKNKACAVNPDETYCDEEVDSIADQLKTIKGSDCAEYVHLLTSMTKCLLENDAECTDNEAACQNEFLSFETFTQKPDFDCAGNFVMGGAEGEYEVENDIKP